jgi:hypothetical protein
MSIIEERVDGDDADGGPWDAILNESAESLHRTGACAQPSDSVQATSAPELATAPT